MDEQTMRNMDRLNRQLRTIKWLLGFFFVMFIAMLAILGFIAFKVVTFTHDISAKVTDIQTKASQNLNFKDQICNNKSVTAFLGNNDLCR